MFERKNEYWTNWFLIEFIKLSISKSLIFLHPQLFWLLSQQEKLVCSCKETVLSIWKLNYGLTNELKLLMELSIAGVSINLLFPSILKKLRLWNTSLSIFEIICERESSKNPFSISSGILKLLSMHFKR